MYVHTHIETSLPHVTSTNGCADFTGCENQLCIWKLTWSFANCSVYVWVVSLIIVLLLFKLCLVPTLPFEILNLKSLCHLIRAVSSLNAAKLEMDVLPGMGEIYSRFLNCMAQRMAQIQWIFCYLPPWPLENWCLPAWKHFLFYMNKALCCSPISQ